MITTHPTAQEGTTVDYNDIPDNPTHLDANVALQTLARYFAQRHPSDTACVPTVAVVTSTVPVDQVTEDTTDALDMDFCTLIEPTTRVPQIDADGFAWRYIESEDEGSGWQRQRIEAGGDARFMMGPPMPDEWDEVVWYGPLRSAEPDDDTGLVVEYFPDGYKDGTPQGESARYTLGEFADFMAARRAGSEA